jgi:hypothetical protein
VPVGCIVAFSSVKLAFRTVCLHLSEIVKSNLLFITRRSAVQQHKDTGHLNSATVPAGRPRLGMVAQTQGTAPIAAAAVGFHSLRARESEKGVPLELRRDLFILASWALGCVKTAQLVVAAALLHQKWADAAGGFLTTTSPKVLK